LEREKFQDSKKKRKTPITVPKLSGSPQATANAAVSSESRTTRRADMDDCIDMVIVHLNGKIKSPHR